MFNTKNRPVWIGCLLTLIVLSGCGSQSETVVDNIPESESLFFTPDGRLFVSGGENVFEIIRTADGHYEKLDTFHKNCLVEGIIQRYDYIYGVCSKTNLVELLQSYLIGAKIEPLLNASIDPADPNRHPSIELDVIAPLPDMGIPNGIEVDEYGNLFVADSGTSNIFRVQFNTPTEIASVDVWAPKVEFFVNGLQWVEDHLYFTAVKKGTVDGVFGRIERNPDGSAGAKELLFQRKGTVLDDFTVYKDGFLITDYLKGSLIYWQAGKVVAESPADTFFAPTAVKAGRPPMFDDRSLLVTEKGIIFNGNPNWGNKLGLYYPPF